MTATLSVVFCAALVWAQQPAQSPRKAPTFEALQAEIDSLKPAHVGWRGIAWKDCLLEGLLESRAREKPVLLWIFIDRPVDDARC
jgi:hypothetical protein